MGALVVPASALALVAPGRITVPFASGHREGVDPFAVSGVAVMPDGRVVTSGINAGARRLLLTRVLRSGAADVTFGGDGVVSLGVPYQQGTYGPYPGPPQLAPDGSVYVASQGPARTKFEGAQVVVTHLLADGTPDPAFGSGGSSMPGVQGASMALTGDGRILIAGHVGQYDIKNVLNPADTTTAVVARLTANGALDPTFGNGGIVTLPGNDAGAVVALPDGGAAVTTTSNETSQLNEVTADGAIAAGFSHGDPLALAGYPDGLLARPDGSVDLLAVNTQRTAAALLRIRPDGTADPAFGGGAVSVPDGTLIPGPAGSDLITTAGSYEPPSGQPFTVIVHRILVDGTPDPFYGGATGRTLALAFGGGYGTPGAIHAQPQVATLNQTGFRGGSVAVRPSGGLVVAGAAAVIQYTGEGEGFEHEDVALAAFAPDLTPDTSFGGPAVKPTVTFSMPRQRAATAAAPRRRYILVRLTASTPGLCQISIRARGAVVAKADVAAFSNLSQNADIWLTKSGRKLLPAARHVATTATATCADLVESRTAASATGLLR
jgi:uncharacterized delta-60 repeat protein